MRKFLTLIFAIGAFSVTGCDDGNTVIKPTEEEAAKLQKAREELMANGGGLGGRDMKPKK